MVSSTISTTPHVVIFPFMAQGHTLPLLDLSITLSRRHVHVTVVSTPANAPSVSGYLSSDENPNISVAEIPFPSSGLPENTSQLPSMDSYVPFLLATRLLRWPFEDLLSRMSDSKTLPICVVSDFFLGWTLASCRRFGVPRLVFHGMGVTSMAICKAVCVHAPHKKSVSDSEPLDMPGLELSFSLTAADLPEMLLSAMGDDEEDPFVEFMKEAGDGEINCWGVVVNTFWDLESIHVPSFESFYAAGAKAWCVGPLYLYQNNNSIVKSKGSVVMDWLTTLDTSASVIYVAFGTQADMSDTQMDEVAYGLEESGFRFVLVARSRTWSVPDGMEERVKGKGIIAREWVDQREILSHRATGGFMSHCGWNSVLESISAGVPILAWPMMAEQSLNAIYVVEGLGAGLRMVERVKSGVIISRERICESVRELMGGDKGRKARGRAQELGQMATRAVQEEGSSSQTLNQLIAQLSAST